MSRRSPPLVLLAAGLVLGDCSLLGYDDFKLASCTADTDCAVLNTVNAIAADACQRYGCDMQAQRCQLRVRDADGDGDPPVACGGHDCNDQNPTIYGGPTPARELCDGLDNNCNLVIDEGAVVPRAPGDAVTGLAPTGHLAYGAGSDGRLAEGYQTDADQGSVALLQAATAVTPTALTYATNSSADSLTDGDLTAGCRSVHSGSSTDGVETGCNFGDLAVDAARDEGDLFVAAVNRSGCGAGQLRIGYLAMAAGTSAAVVVRGPAARSDSYHGIDVDMNGCTGASRVTAMPGAAAPAVAALARPSAPIPQALVAWLGDAVTRPACGGPAANVEVLGAWLETGTAAGVSLKWVNATGNGLPQVLGTTAGGGRPAVVAWGDRGYFVGYGAMNGQPTLRFVPAPGDPPPYLTTAPPATARPTAALVLEPAFGIQVPGNGGTGADHVALALGAIRTTGLDVGVAWQQGCGTPAAGVWFARVRFMAGSPGTFAAGTPVRVSGDGGAAAPTVAYVSTGFVAPGYARRGMTAAADTTGGWVVAWTDTRVAPARVLARRVAALDAALLDEADIDLTFAPAGVPRAGVGPDQAVLYSAPAAPPGLLRYAYHDTTRNTLVGADLLCAPGATAGH